MVFWEGSKYFDLFLKLTQRPSKDRNKILIELVVTIDSDFANCFTSKCTILLKLIVKARTISNLLYYREDGRVDCLLCPVHHPGDVEDHWKEVVDRVEVAVATNMVERLHLTRVVEVGVITGIKQNGVLEGNTIRELYLWTIGGGLGTVKRTMVGETFLKGETICRKSGVSRCLLITPIVMSTVFTFIYFSGNFFCSLIIIINLKSD